ncbi:glutamate-rich protein 6-like [Hydractinia symbiolongicarpus]|uniref:glutamate-rich protein 6-like n=1 Tax=Hydractinia symbiolongicarpus TaxID=13093 RepID=UPI0025502659|nr:glutamate-rich protein 6-like [Hydractinia symbiolongicarpus]XP_057301057.1 glutamate-rich protein 6-like [Hydractinia symbiolongicarpus]XP_057301058.1 glutamate-rich protein 6-like [Hydractinia symbiolongicarpus]XP_057301059.1 glutamate-rich protein 6-like [Hydractinia symbiolongicarpus]
MADSDNSNRSKKLKSSKKNSNSNKRPVVKKSNSPIDEVKSKQQPQESPKSPLSISSATSIPWDSPIFQKSRSSTPESDVEASIAYIGTKSYNDVKRKRKLKKRKDRSRSEINFISKLLKDNTLEDISLTSSNNNEEAKNLTGIPIASLPSSANGEESKNVSCQDHLLFTPTPGECKYISQAVQTEWSYLEDMEMLEKNKQKVRDALDHVKVTNAKEKQEEPVKKNIGTQQVPQHVKSVNEVEVEKKTKRRLPSTASIESKSKLNFSSDSVESDTSTQWFEEEKERSAVGPPEILKYRREKPMKTIRSSKLLGELPKSECGLYSSRCHCCGELINSVPTLADIQNADSSDQLFCCAEYKHFITLHLTSKDIESDTEDETINIIPRVASGSEVNQKEVKEKVAERQRERELERQKAAAQQANLYSFARQMKTIQFSLTSMKCMEDGWTIKPVSPIPEKPVIEDDNFKIEVNTTLLQKSEILNQRFYENGKRFLTIFPDGTGCCYYPNGTVAVMITSTEKGKYTYIVQSNTHFDNLEDDGILALFEPNGHAICYHKRNHRLRLFVNAHGGIEFDKKGNKRKRWQWYFVKGHVHAPPFQPLCFPLNKYLSVRVLDQQNIALIFSSSKRTVRFNVGANLTALTIKGHARFEADESELYLNRKRQLISTTLTQLHNALRLPKSTRFDRMCPTRILGKTTSKSSLPPIDNASPKDVESNIIVN